ncbi:MAG: hypothetical protein GXP22_07010 [Gammaproteobacteria bacterium]|nr:hypothetical protein [Gammaproteobacteria bacterium]
MNIDQSFFALSLTYRLSALAKKSFFSVNSLILACRSFSWLSSALLSNVSSVSVICLEAHEYDDKKSHKV